MDVGLEHRGMIRGALTILTSEQEKLKEALSNSRDVVDGNDRNFQQAFGENDRQLWEAIRENDTKLERTIEDAMSSAKK